MPEEQPKLTEHELTKKVEKASERIKVLLDKINETDEFTLKLSGFTSFVLSPSENENYAHVVAKLTEHEREKAMLNYISQIKNILADLSPHIEKRAIIHRPTPSKIIKPN